MITKLFKLTLFFLILFQLFPTAVGAETRSYLITDGFTEPFPTFVNGRVYFSKSMGMEYKSGTVVLSSNPDGTGNITVGDMLQVDMGYPHQGQLFLQGYSNGCLSFQDIYPPQNITHFFKAHLNQGMHSLLIRLRHYCLRPKTIEPIYLVHTIPDVTPSPTPTAVPSPTPVPFLDLPWDYESRGMTFIDAALSMSSYFDHEYPLLSGGISEPIHALGTVISYEKNVRTNDLSYSNHDGYDYASKAKVRLGDPVLAAAAGTARYVKSCGACGHMILIDHGNGYQTRYLHLQSEGLITTDPSAVVAVTAGQQIGRVGFSGHVIPAGERGAHIHFAVFQDKNGDGSFADNIPDGATDPFGWKSAEPDPWEHFTFQYQGIERQGNKSHYLFKHAIDDRHGEVPPEGVAFTIHKASAHFPDGATDINLNLNFGVSPVIEPSALLQSVGAGYFIKATDPLGNIVNSFLQPFTFIIDFLSYDLSHIKPETLSIYSSQDGVHWVKEQTTIDMTTGIATAHIDHLTQFALMAERADIEAPITHIQVSGQQGEENIFRSAVTVSFESADNEGGLGVEYTAYKVEKAGEASEWTSYTDPVVFSAEGDYRIEYYSADLDDNIEELKSVEFSIDTTPPEAEIVYDFLEYDLVIIGRDDTEYATVSSTDLGKKKEQIVISDKAGNTLTIMAKEKEKGKKAVMNIYSLQNNNNPPIEVGDNKILFNAATDKNNILKSFNQLYNVKGEKKLELDYKAKTNQTKVIVKVKGQDKEKEILDGIVLLKLFTNKGLILSDY